MVFKKMAVLIENWLTDSVSSTIKSSFYLIYLITKSGLMIYIIIYFIFYRGRMKFVEINVNFKVIQVMSHESGVQT